MQQINLNRKSRRILTIDDNDAIHGDFKKILLSSVGGSKLQGAKAKLFGAAPAADPTGVTFEVDSALQGEEGLAKLQSAIREERPFSVAFVDMRMPPGWDGLQTIQRLWEVDPDLQIVICSAFSDYSWEEISAKLGLTDRLLILKKPFDPAEVTQLATALSEKWFLRRESKLKMEQLEVMVQQRTEELTKLAMCDKLTGLPNRVALSERLARSVKRAASDSNYQFALLFLDFDRFKLINDSLGHDAGDMLLKSIAGRLEAGLKLAGRTVGEPMAARLGGDEFVILIDQLSCQKDATDFADALLGMLRSPYQLEGREVQSSASIGVTTSELKYATPDEMLRDADTSMYHAKAAGKGRWMLFDRRMHQEVQARLELESDLRTALERKELHLQYQPIVSLRNGMIDGFEALVRWHHPLRGTVSPLEFIPCCEDIGLIVPFGAWILGQACRQLHQWEMKYPNRRLTMSVNVSARQLTAPEFVGEVKRVLGETKIDPTALVLEITESVFIGDGATAAEALRQLRDLGIRIHMDDFGTGYSSLSCLHSLPLDGLKIDRKFMQNMCERRDYAAVVHAIVTLARNLDLQLVAEGIETPDQVAMLQAMECDLAQGYFFGKAMDGTAAEGMITASNLKAQAA